MAASWEEVIRRAIERSLDGLHTSIPAKVTDYLPLLQQCSVEPVIEGMPELTDVPVAWTRGGGHAQWGPLEAGDHVLLIFCEQDFGPWRLLGSASAPAQLRRHGLFAYALPGAAPDLSPLLGPTLLDGSTIGEDGPGGNVVNVGSAGVNLGAFPFTQQVALAALVDAFNSALAVWASTHTHLGNLGAPTGPPVVPPPTASPTGSVVVKCSG